MATTPASSKTASSSGSGRDTLTLGLAEDAYQGDAQFTVTVDGVLVSTAAQTVTASHAAGKEQQFTFAGNWGPGRIRSRSSISTTPMAAPRRPTATFI